MRIMHFSVGICHPDNANGVNQTIYHLSQHQVAKGHEVAIYVFDDQPPIPIANIETRSYPEHKLKFIVSDKFKHDVVAWQPDIVHIHPAYSPATAGFVWWLQQAQIPYTITTHGHMSQRLIDRNPYIKVPYKLLVQRPYLNKALFIHAIGDAHEVQEYGVTVPTVTAYNGFDFDRITGDLDPENIYEDYPQLRGKQIYLFLGRLALFQKGLDVMIESFAKAGLKDTVLVLVGPDSEGNRTMLQKQIDRLDMQNNILMTGPIYGVKKFEFLKVADCFVHTSRWEGHSFSLTEATALGLPCIITRGADPSGVVEKFDAGITVNFDLTEIMHAFQKFSHLSQTERDRMSTNSIRMVHEVFNWDVTADIILEAYARYLCDISNKLQ